MLRRRRVLATVKELDAFPKVPETYKEPSTAGRGTLSVATFLLISFLVLSEIRYHMDSDLKFDYKVDLDKNETVSLNIDVTVAMECGYLGADVLDISNKHNAWISGGSIEEEPVFFDLSPRQKEYQLMVTTLNNRLKSEYHALHKFLWKSGVRAAGHNMPPREDIPDRKPDACRYHGTVEIGKVAGNFHVTAGRSIPFPRGHAHLALMIDDDAYNFSHRIDEFSFGERSPGKINPLDGDLKITKHHRHAFQYFLQVVPTAVSTSHAQLDTFQYAVTEQTRPIDHESGSHGVPGIFMKYDFASFKVEVKEEAVAWYTLIIRICGIVGGVFATSTMLTSYGDSARHLLAMIFGKTFSQSAHGSASSSQPSSSLHSSTLYSSPNSPLQSSALSHAHLLTLSPAQTVFDGANSSSQSSPATSVATDSSNIPSTFIPTSAGSSNSAVALSPPSLAQIS